MFWECNALANFLYKFYLRILQFTKQLTWSEVGDLKVEFLLIKNTCIVQKKLRSAAGSWLYKF